MNMNHDPWVVREKPQPQPPLPCGFYVGPFKGWAEVKLDSPNLKASDEGLRWRWAWTVQTGPEAGKEATALTNRDISPQSQAGVLIAGLLGRSIQPGENVKAAVEACVGKPYMVSVQAGPKGGKPAVRSVGAPPQM